jgi:hypothetical protein
LFLFFNLLHVLSQINIELNISVAISLIATIVITLETEFGDHLQTNWFIVLQPSPF